MGLSRGLLTGISQGISALSKDISNERLLKQRQALEASTREEQLKLHEQGRQDRLEAQEKTRQTSFLNNTWQQLLRTKSGIQDRIVAIQADFRMKPKQKAVLIDSLKKQLAAVDQQLTAVVSKLSEISGLEPIAIPQPLPTETPEEAFVDTEQEELIKTLGRGEPLAEGAKTVLDPFATAAEAIIALPLVVAEKVHILAGGKTFKESIENLSKSIATRRKQGKPVDKLLEARKKLFDASSTAAKREELVDKVSTVLLPLGLLDKAKSVSKNLDVRQKPAAEEILEQQIEAGAISPTTPTLPLTGDPVLDASLKQHQEKQQRILGPAKGQLPGLGPLPIPAGVQAQESGRKLVSGAREETSKNFQNFLKNLGF